MLVWSNSCASLNTVLKKQQVWTFADQFETSSSKMLCLHRWKIWWTIPKLLTSELCPEKNVPPETYFLLSQFQVNIDIIEMLI